MDGRHPSLTRDEASRILLQRPMTVCFIPLIWQEKGPLVRDGRQYAIYVGAGREDPRFSKDLT